MKLLLSSAGVSNPSILAARLGLVDLTISSHLDHPGFTSNTMAQAERWAADIGGPAYAIDDQTALQVVDGQVTVVSEGQWRYFGVRSVAATRCVPDLTRGGPTSHSLQT